jgi:conjugation transfer TcpE-like protein
MSEEPDEAIMCATYTHARRHPMVLGHIGGWTPPFQLTVSQIVVLLGTFFVESQTWGLWGRLLPRTVAAVLAVGVPITLAWLVRRTHVEGRSLPRAGRGWLTYLTAPRHGTVGGHAHRPPRRVTLGGHGTVVASARSRR